jgi:hypothetical protein
VTCRYVLSFGPDQSVAVYSTAPLTRRQIDLLIKGLRVARKAALAALYAHATAEAKEE